MAASPAYVGCMASGCASATADVIASLLSLHGDVVYRVALQLTDGDEPAARALMREGVRRLWRRAEVFEPDQFKGWVADLLRDLCRDGMLLPPAIPVRLDTDPASEVSLADLLSDDTP